MNLSEHTPDTKWAMDMSGFVPAGVGEAPDGTQEYTHDCLECGFNVWKIMATFTNYEISGYFIEMSCASCGTIADAPTLVDHPAHVKE